MQFNPETLKVTFANQVQQPQGGGDQTRPAVAPVRRRGHDQARAAALVRRDGAADADEGIDDVRELTGKVAYFITPQQGATQAATRAQTQLVPPGVRFVWGSFQFDGIMDSLEESLEFFSADGKPLRASMSLSLRSRRSSTRRSRPAGGRAGRGRGR